MNGTTVFITGATAGMGLHLARNLALRGATLLLHGRRPDRLEQLAQELRQWSPEVRTYVADLADLRQVYAMTARIRDVEPRLDVVVNNAAVDLADQQERKISHDGYELRLAVNHLAPYLLVQELAPLLAASAPARVVNVASMGQAPIDLDDLMFTRDYDAVQAYCRSKLAMIMATFELASQLEDRRITVNAVHPAHLMDTAMVRNSGFTPVTTVDDGVLPTLRLIADSALRDVTGRYFFRFDEARAHEQAYDLPTRAMLLTETITLTSMAALTRQRR
jgi:NAD(P)-dependent dehydrogenase (short-subunit alcohol dehydrogenase family)